MFCVLQVDCPRFARGVCIKGGASSQFKAMWLPSSKHPKYPTICISLKTLPQNERSRLPAMISKVAVGLISYTSYIIHISIESNPNDSKWRLKKCYVTCYTTRYYKHIILSTIKKLVCCFLWFLTVLKLCPFLINEVTLHWTLGIFPWRLLHRTLELLVLNITIQKPELKPWSVGLADWHPRLFSFLLSNVGKKTHTGFQIMGLS